MLIKRKRGWEIKESEITPERYFLDRRSAIFGLAGAAAVAATGGIGRTALAQAKNAPQTSGLVAPELYPAKRNEAYQAGRELTEEKVATNYNNFYEFGTNKYIADSAQKLTIKPWRIQIDGMVEKPIEIDAEELIRKMPVEERIYRFRCVEAWAMTVPWSGFQLSELVKFAKPAGDPKYLRMQTFVRSDEARGQRQDWYPWPYTEGLSMAEAMNEMAFMVTGAYGKPLPKQMGAPIRLATPWKYGFKSVKSIVRFSFTNERPRTFWEGLAPDEYGFWANVNPAVAHPRWSQATEEIIGTGKRIPSVIYNGYGEQVAALYKDIEGGTGRKLFM
ncbi:protein-methionine-sulfoxide reductase catalytic subunit MsrP [Ferrovibrio sp. MS7]|uniref:protein-methionine-sulfoxide reductase catalytic subunit MsrP n=1 Tax=Ferrovibrio plantarum TaxID=3119164 RepID=UPI003134FC17